MYNKRMKQATPNIRTIDHADHTDIERLFYVYLLDNGKVSRSAIWAVVWCGLKQENAMELKDARKCDVNGTQVIICDVLETGAVLPHSILLDEYLNPTWEQDADSVFGFLKAAEASEYVQPEYKEAQQVAYKFNFDTVAEQEF